MESKLRRKFILISMSAVAIVLFIVVCIMNLINYTQLILRSDETIDIISEHDGEFPSVLNRTFERLNIESAYSTRFFTIKIDNSNKIIVSDTSKIYSINQESAEYLGVEILKFNAHSGFIDSFRYEIIDKPYGKLLVFIDYYEEISILKSFFNISLLLCLNILLAIFILILIFSKKFIAPIIENNEQQKQFITDISHELKTPLSIIKVNTEVIEMENNPSEWSASIHHQVTRLNELIQYLISLTKLDEEDTKLMKTEFILANILDDIVPSFKGLANNKNMNIVSKAEEKTYLGDQQSIKLLLSILIENAIKYGAENTDIFINIRKNKNKCYIEIENNVENIKIGDYSQWFQRFYRGDSSRNSSSEGFGIGLAMAESIVKRNHGKISAKSLDGKSVIFKIEI